MTTISFEEYLAQIHADQYIGVDDDMSDDFQEWLQALGADQIIEYAEKWGH